MRDRFAGTSLLVMAALLGGTPAWAQAGAGGAGGGSTSTAASRPAPEGQADQSPSATPTTPGDSDEIVVTGLKRDEKFIDVPVAVQVFSEQAIVQAGITRPQDFLNLTPNVTFIQSNHAGEAFVNVRGQSSVRQSESAVAVVIDGVQLATQNEFNGDLFDVQQIEVLKGPQSALYGRNATAGAIIITTKQPTDEFEGGAVLSYGEFNTARAQVSASGAIVPGKLRFRVAGAFNNTDGPFRNIITGERPYRSQEALGRVRLDWEVTPDFKLDYRANISRLRGGAIAANAQGPGIVNGGEPSPVDGNLVDIPFVADAPGKNLQDKFSTSLKADWELGIGTLTSVTSYNKIIDRYEARLFPYQASLDPRNDAGNAILFGDQTQKYRISNEAIIQELRLTSKGDRRFRWQVGLFYLNSTRDFFTEQGFNGRVPVDAAGRPQPGINGYLPDPNGNIFASLDPAIGTFLFGAPTQRFRRVLQGGGVISPTLGIDGLDSVNPTNAYDVSRFRAENFAPFGNFQLDITERLELGVALRYDIERRSVQTLTPNIINPFTGASFSQCVAVLGISPDQCRRSRTFEEIQPKFTLTYKVPDFGSAYVTWGRGFKSGGFNPIGTREIVVRATAVGSDRATAERLTFVQDSYDKEVSDSLEVGFKTQLFDRRLNFNGAFFRTDVQNSQQFIFFPAGSVQAVLGIDKVRIDGFEFDANGRVFDWLTLFAGYGWVDPRIRRFAAAPEAVGNRAPYIARYNLTLGGQLNARLNDDGLKLLGRIEWNRQGSMWFDALNTPDTQRRAIDLVNARFGIGGERWELNAFARNLFNEKYRVENVVLITGIGVFNPGFEGQRRVAGLEGRINF